MTQRVCIIGGGVIGLATAYALVRDGFDVTVVEARDSLGSETSFANGGQLSYRYVAPLADAGVPLQAIGWMLRGDRSEEHTSELQSRFDLVCRLLLEKKKPASTTVPVRAVSGC